MKLHHRNLLVLPFRNHLVRAGKWLPHTDLLYPSCPAVHVHLRHKTPFPMVSANLRDHLRNYLAPRPHNHVGHTPADVLYYRRSTVKVVLRLLHLIRCNS